MIESRKETQRNKKKKKKKKKKNKKTKKSFVTPSFYQGGPRWYGKQLK